MTIRRDLEHLEGQGMLSRSHGGASATRRVRLEFALDERAERFGAQKTAIGRAAASLIAQGDHVLVDTGTTSLALARELRGWEGVSVVTTSLAVVSALLSSPGIECMLLGGIVRENSPDLYGPLLEDNLSRIHPDWAFIGCDGLSIESGLTTSDPRVAHANRLMVRNAGRVALLVDCSKAGRDSFISFADLTDIDVLITDEGMPAEILEAARAVGVETITVSSDQKSKTKGA